MLRIYFMAILCYNVTYRYKTYLKYVSWRSFKISDYKELYLKMARASEQAIGILIKAQLECEESYLSSYEPELTIVPFAAQQGQGDKLEK